MGLNPIAYVVHKVSTSLNYIHQEYRQRFGIESSYRLKNICRIRTTTKKPNLRLLFVGISFLLVNIWINLLWRKISQPRRGGRLIFRDIFNSLANARIFTSSCRPNLSSKRGYLSNL